MKNYIGLIIAVIYWSLLLIVTFFIDQANVKQRSRKLQKLKKFREAMALQEALKNNWYYFERFFYYSGIKFIISKFIPIDKKKLPTGVIWLLCLYFAAYAFTSQRYESQLDRIEFKYNTFTAQIAGGTKFSNSTLMRILNEKIPVMPSIENPISVFQSFFYGLYSWCFYEIDFETAADYRQDIIREWDRKLNWADFNRAELEGVDFRGAKLYGADFFWAELDHANFKEALLDGADFFLAELNWTDFHGAKLDKTNFKRAQLDHANFEDTKFLIAKQLISARSIYGIRNCPPKVLDEIKEYGCSEMLTRPRNKWSKRFIEHRNKLLEKWKNEKS